MFSGPIGDYKQIVLFSNYKDNPQIVSQVLNQLGSQIRSTRPASLSIDPIVVRVTDTLFRDYLTHSPTLTELFTLAQALHTDKVHENIASLVELFSYAIELGMTVDILQSSSVATTFISDHIQLLEFLFSSTTAEHIWSAITCVELLSRHSVAICQQLTRSFNLYSNNFLKCPEYPFIAPPETKDDDLFNVKAHPVGSGPVIQQRARIKPSAQADPARPYDAEIRRLYITWYCHTLRWQDPQVFANILPKRPLLDRIIRFIKNDPIQSCELFLQTLVYSLLLSQSSTIPQVASFFSGETVKSIIELASLSSDRQTLVNTFLDAYVRVFLPDEFAASYSSLISGSSSGSTDLSLLRDDDGHDREEDDDDDDDDDDHIDFDDAPQQSSRHGGRQTRRNRTQHHRKRTNKGHLMVKLNALYKLILKLDVVTSVFQQQLLLSLLQACPHLFIAYIRAFPYSFDIRHPYRAIPLINLYITILRLPIDNSILLSCPYLFGELPSVTQQQPHQQQHKRAQQRQGGSNDTSTFIPQGWDCLNINMFTLAGVKTSSIYEFLTQQQQQQQRQGGDRQSNTKPHHRQQPSASKSTDAIPLPTLMDLLIPPSLTKSTFTVGLSSTEHTVRLAVLQMIITLLNRYADLADTLFSIYVQSLHLTSASSSSMLVNSGPNYQSGVTPSTANGTSSPLQRILDYSYRTQSFIVTDLHAIAPQTQRVTSASKGCNTSPSVQLSKLRLGYFSLSTHQSLKQLLPDFDTITRLYSELFVLAAPSYSNPPAALAVQNRTALSTLQQTQKTGTKPKHGSKSMGDDDTENQKDVSIILWNPACITLSDAVIADHLTTQCLRLVQLYSLILPDVLSENRFEMLKLLKYSTLSYTMPTYTQAVLSLLQSSLHSTYNTDIVPLTALPPRVTLELFLTASPALSYACSDLTPFHTDQLRTYQSMNHAYSQPVRMISTVAGPITPFGMLVHGMLSHRPTMPSSFLQVVDASSSFLQPQPLRNYHHSAISSSLPALLLSYGAGGSLQMPNGDILPALLSRATVQTNDGIVLYTPDATQHPVTLADGTPASQESILYHRLITFFTACDSTGANSGYLSSQFSSEQHFSHQALLQQTSYQCLVLILRLLHTSSGYQQQQQQQLQAFSEHQQQTHSSSVIDLVPIHNLLEMETMSWLTLTTWPTADLLEAMINFSLTRRDAQLTSLIHRHGLLNRLETWAHTFAKKHKSIRKYMASYNIYAASLTPLSLASLFTLSLFKETGPRRGFASQFVARGLWNAITLGYGHSYRDIAPSGDTVTENDNADTMKHSISIDECQAIVANALVIILLFTADDSDSVGTSEKDKATLGKVTHIHTSWLMSDRFTQLLVQQCYSLVLSLVSVVNPTLSQLSIQELTTQYTVSIDTALGNVIEVLAPENDEDEDSSSDDDNSSSGSDDDSDSDSERVGDSTPSTSKLLLPLHSQLEDMVVQSLTVQGSISPLFALLGLVPSTSYHALTSRSVLLYLDSVGGTPSQLFTHLSQVYICHSLHHPFTQQANDHGHAILTTVSPVYPLGTSPLTFTPIQYLLATMDVTYVCSLLPCLSTIQCTSHQFRNILSFIQWRLLAPVVSSLYVGSFNAGQDTGKSPQLYNPFINRLLMADSTSFIFHMIVKIIQQMISLKSIAAMSTVPEAQDRTTQVIALLGYCLSVIVSFERIHADIMTSHHLGFVNKGRDGRLDGPLQSGEHKRPSTGHTGQDNIVSGDFSWLNMVFELLQNTSFISRYHQTNDQSSHHAFVSSVNSVITDLLNHALTTLLVPSGLKMHPISSKSPHKLYPAIHDVRRALSKPHYRDVYAHQRYNAFQQNIWQFIMGQAHQTPSNHPSHPTSLPASLPIVFSSTRDRLVCDAEMTVQHCTRLVHDVYIPRYIQQFHTRFNEISPSLSTSEMRSFTPFDEFATPSLLLLQIMTPSQTKTLVDGLQPSGKTSHQQHSSSAMIVVLNYLAQFPEIRQRLLPYQSRRLFPILTTLSIDEVQRQRHGASHASQAMTDSDSDSDSETESDDSDNNNDNSSSYAAGTTQEGQKYQAMLLEYLSQHGSVLLSDSGDTQLGFDVTTLHSIIKQYIPSKNEVKQLKTFATALVSAPSSTFGSNDRAEDITHTSIQLIFRLTCDMLTSSTDISTIRSSHGTLIRYFLHILAAHKDLGVLFFYIRMVLSLIGSLTTVSQKKSTSTLYSCLTHGFVRIIYWISDILFKSSTMTVSATTNNNVMDVHLQLCQQFCNLVSQILHPLMYTMIVSGTIATFGDILRRIVSPMSSNLPIDGISLAPFAEYFCLQASPTEQIDPILTEVHTHLSTIVVTLLAYTRSTRVTTTLSADAISQSLLVSIVAELSHCASLEAMLQTLNRKTHGSTSNSSPFHIHKVALHEDVVRRLYALAVLSMPMLTPSDTTKPSHHSQQSLYALLLHPDSKLDRHAPVLTSFGSQLFGFLAINAITTCASLVSLSPSDVFQDKTSIARRYHANAIYTRITMVTSVLTIYNSISSLVIEDTQMIPSTHNGASERPPFGFIFPFLLAMCLLSHMTTLTCHPRILDAITTGKSKKQSSITQRMVDRYVSKQRDKYRQQVNRFVVVASRDAISLTEVVPTSLYYLFITSHLQDDILYQQIPYLQTKINRVLQASLAFIVEPQHRGSKSQYLQLHLIHPTQQSWNDGLDYPHLFTQCISHAFDYSGDFNTPIRKLSGISPFTFSQHAMEHQAKGEDLYNTPFHFYRHLVTSPLLIDLLCPSVYTALQAQQQHWDIDHLTMTSLSEIIHTHIDHSYSSTNGKRGSSDQRLNVARLAHRDVVTTRPAMQITLLKLFLHLIPGYYEPSKPIASPEADTNGTVPPSFPSEMTFFSGFISSILSAYTATCSAVDQVIKLILLQIQNHCLGSHLGTKPATKSITKHVNTTQTLAPPPPPLVLPFTRLFNTPSPYHNPRMRKYSKKTLVIPLDKYACLDHIYHVPLQFPIFFTSYSLMWGQSQQQLLFKRFVVNTLLNTLKHNEDDDTDSHRKTGVGSSTSTSLNDQQQQLIAFCEQQIVQLDIDQFEDEFIRHHRTAYLRGEQRLKTPHSKTQGKDRQRSSAPDEENDPDGSTKHRKEEDDPHTSIHATLSDALSPHSHYPSVDYILEQFRRNILQNGLHPCYVADDNIHMMTTDSHKNQRTTLSYLDGTNPTTYYDAGVVLSMIFNYVQYCTISLDLLTQNHLLSFLIEALSSTVVPFRRLAYHAVNRLFILLSALNQRYTRSRFEDQKHSVLTALKLRVQQMQKNMEYHVGDERLEYQLLRQHMLRMQQYTFYHDFHQVDYAQILEKQRARSQRAFTDGTRSSSMNDDPFGDDDDDYDRYRNPAMLASANIDWASRISRDASEHERRRIMTEYIERTFKLPVYHTFFDSELQSIFKGDHSVLTPIHDDERSSSRDRSKSKSQLLPYSYNIPITLKTYMFPSQIYQLLLLIKNTSNVLGELFQRHHGENYNPDELQIPRLTPLQSYLLSHAITIIVKSTHPLFPSLNRHIFKYFSIYTSKLPLFQQFFFSSSLAIQHQRTFFLETLSRSIVPHTDTIGGQRYDHSENIYLMKLCVRHNIFSVLFSYYISDILFTPRLRLLTLDIIFKLISSTKYALWYLITKHNLLLFLKNALVIHVITPHSLRTAEFEDDDFGTRSRSQAVVLGKSASSSQSHLTRPLKKWNHLELLLIQKILQIITCATETMTSQHLWASQVFDDTTRFTFQNDTDDNEDERNNEDNSDVDDDDDTVDGDDEANLVSDATPHPKRLRKTDVSSSNELHSIAPHSIPSDDESDDVFDDNFQSLPSVAALLSSHHDFLEPEGSVANEFLEFSENTLNKSSVSEYPSQTPQTAFTRLQVTYLHQLLTLFDTFTAIPWYLHDDVVRVLASIYGYLTHIRPYAAAPAQAVDTLTSITSSVLLYESHLSRPSQDKNLLQVARLTQFMLDGLSGIHTGSLPTQVPSPSRSFASFSSNLQTEQTTTSRAIAFITSPCYQDYHGTYNLRCNAMVPTTTSHGRLQHYLLMTLCLFLYLKALSSGTLNNTSSVDSPIATALSPFIKTLSSSDKKCPHTDSQHLLRLLAHQALTFSLSPSITALAQTRLPTPITPNDHHVHLIHLLETSFSMDHSRITLSTTDIAAISHLLSLLKSNSM